MAMEIERTSISAIVEGTEYYNSNASVSDTHENKEGEEAVSKEQTAPAPPPSYSTKTSNGDKQNDDFSVLSTEIKNEDDYVKHTTVTTAKALRISRRSNKGMILTYQSEIMEDAPNSNLLSSVHQNEWTGRRVLIRIGPLSGYEGKVIEWANGWVTITINVLNGRHHKRRACELSLLPYNYDNNESSFPPEANTIADPSYNASNNKSTLTTTNDNITPQEEVNCNTKLTCTTTSNSAEENGHDLKPCGKIKYSDMVLMLMNLNAYEIEQANSSSFTDTTTTTKVVNYGSMVDMLCNLDSYDIIQSKKQKLDNTEYNDSSTTISTRSQQQYSLIHDEKEGNMTLNVPNPTILNDPFPTTGIYFNSASKEWMVSKNKHIAEIYITSSPSLSQTVAIANQNTTKNDNMIQESSISCSNGEEEQEKIRFQNARAIPTSTIVHHFETKFEMQNCFSISQWCHRLVCLQKMKVNNNNDNNKEKEPNKQKHPNETTTIERQGSKKRKGYIPRKLEDLID